MRQESDKSIPNFHLEKSTKKWGQIQTEVLRINCAKEDAKRLKQLLAEASGKKLLAKGTFIPAGLHLMEGKEIVTNILRANTNKTVEETIHDIEGVISVEKTGGYQYRNKWMLVIKMEKETEVQKQLAEKIAILYENQVGQTRLITTGTNYTVKQHTKRTKVGTYAEMLMKQFLPIKKQQTKKETQHTNKDDGNVSIGNVDEGKTEHTQEISPETTNIKGNTHVTNETDYTTIVRKMLRIEETQKQILKEQAEQKRIVQEIPSNERSVESKEKIKKIEQNLLQEIDTKFQKAINEQTIRHENTEKRLESAMHEQVETRLEKMSNTLATQVAAQILEVFKQQTGTNTYGQYVQRPNITRTELITQEMSPEISLFRRNTSQITRDEYKMGHEERTENVQQNSIQKNVDQKINDYEQHYLKTDTTTDLLKALNEIDTKETERHSHHDVTKECFKEVR